jgi:hypothetical protein
LAYLIQQTKLLEDLANLLYNSYDGEYETISCECNSMPDFQTFGITLSIRSSGVDRYVMPPEGMASKSIDSIEKLHDLMKAHTGREWTSFTLTLDANGKAHTKFHYPDDPV